MFCGRCNGVIWYPQGESGTTIPCPHCGDQTFLIYQSDATYQEPPPTPLSKQEKRISTTSQHYITSDTSKSKTYHAPYSAKSDAAYVEEQRKQGLAKRATSNEISVEDIERQRRRLEAEKAQIGINSAAPAPANQNAEPSFIDSAVIGIIVGIIVALVIGVACLVASKIGYDGLGSFMSYWRLRLLRDLGIGMLVIPPVMLVISFLQKKKNQTYKDALKDGAFVTCGTIALISCFILTFQFFYSTPPEKADIDYGVNWALATEYRIEWTDKKSNIFDNYRLTNQYSETVGSEKHLVYDFEAQCPLLVYSSSDGSGRTDYAMARGNPNSIMTTLSGSVTLVKKGEDWYCNKTIRVH
jgi:hypothetical protein